jgi:hypothetical protein
MAKKRKTRGGDWAQMRDAQAKNRSTPKGVEGREKVPEIACGKCKKFSENAYGSDGSGYCTALKMGSDITKDPPVYILEGEASLMTMFNMDAAKCKYFEKMAYIDTDATECADPHHRRTQRQMGNLNK